MTRDMISVCAHCGYHHNAISAVMPAGAKRREPTPAPGSLTMCIQCGGWCVIDKYMRLRKATAAELRRIEQNAAMKRTRLAWLLTMAVRSEKPS
jgi:hypothetical protein